MIGHKLKQLRKQKGLSQEQVAEHLHMSQSAFARIENGDSNSWANYIMPISNLFEIQPEDLLKQDSIIVNQNQKGGNGAYVINQLSEKLIEQYEKNAKLKDTIIADLRMRLTKYENG